jgi:hypothetical protein
MKSIGMSCNIKKVSICIAHCKIVQRKKSIKTTNYFQATATLPVLPVPWRVYVLPLSQTQLCSSCFVLKIKFLPRTRRCVLLVNMHFHIVPEEGPRSAKLHHQDWIPVLMIPKWYFNSKPALMYQALREVVSLSF